MGNLIWHEYARLVSITACVYAVWAGYWGIFYRKFFWDFVAGIFRDPGGIQPADSVKIFITIIVDAPVLQIMSIISGMSLLMLELPAPFVKGTSIHRSIVVRIVALLMQTFTCILYYQGTNAALYSFVAALGYIRAQTLGEVMEEAKDNRGKGGRA